MNADKIQNVYSQTGAHSKSELSLTSVLKIPFQCLKSPFCKFLLLGVFSFSLGALADDHSSKTVEKAQAELAVGAKKVQVVFTQKDDKTVLVSIMGEGFTDSSVHGLHIHEFGKCEGPEYKTAGGHFNPTSMPHGAPSMKTHVGDLGNVTGDKKGHYKHELTLHNVSLNGENSILGKSVVLHAKADDFKTQPSGDSGSRVGCSVIEQKK